MTGGKKEKEEQPNFQELESVTRADGKAVTLFEVSLECLIYEKGNLLFSKLFVLEEDLFLEKLNLKEQQENLLLKTNWNKELGKAKPTIAEKDAWMSPKLKPFNDKIHDLEVRIKFYKNKLTIINDLISLRKTEMKISEE